MTRSNAVIEKAARLVVDEQVVVTYVSPRGQVLAGTVAGDHGIYQVTVDPAGEWCDCAFGKAQRGQPHSHTLAVMLAARMAGWLPPVADPATMTSPPGDDDREEVNSGT